MRLEKMGDKDQDCCSDSDKKDKEDSHTSECCC